MTALTVESGVLNYVVTGEVRSGTAVVQTSLCNRVGAVCHGDLFNASEEVRKEAHESYFGPSGNPERPGWFRDGLTSPWQYINREVLDNPQRGEHSVGLKLLYPEVKRWELFELFEHRCREGDFCVVHVVRNPAACFISLKQAERSGNWSRGLDAREGRSPSPIIVDTAEMLEFCRAHMAMRTRIQRASAIDVLELRYGDLLVHYQKSMRKVFDFLELPDIADPPVASCRRLRNREMRERVFNWDALYKASSCEVRTLLDAEDMV